MQGWARRNPMLARVLLRFALRLAVALAAVLALMPLAERQGVSPNIAAIAAVVIGLVAGTRLAERVARLWGLPPDEARAPTRPAPPGSGDQA